MAREPHRQQFRAVALIATHWRATLAVTVILVILFIVLPGISALYVDITTPAWEYWLETVSGNWAPGNYPPLILTPSNQAASPASEAISLSFGQRFEFAFSAILAVFLNNAMIIGVVGVTWKILHERTNAMAVTLLKTLVTRDATMEADVTDALMQYVVPHENLAKVKEHVHVAIEAAREKWINEILDEVYGPERAERIRAQYRSELNI